MDHFLNPSWLALDPLFSCLVDFVHHGLDEFVLRVLIKEELFVLRWLMTIFRRMHKPSAGVKHVVRSLF